MHINQSQAGGIVFQGVPGETYAGKASPTTGTGIMTPAEGWHTRIELKAGEATTLVFPKSK